MQVLSLIWGILAVIGWLTASMPCLGSLNWISIPFATIGLIISIVTYVNEKVMPKGMALAGIIMCGIAMIFSVFRLIAGGGVV